MWFFIGLIVLVILWAVSPAIPILITIVGSIYVIFSGGKGKDYDFGSGSGGKKVKWPPKKRTKAQLRAMKKKMGI